MNRPGGAGRAVLTGLDWTVPEARGRRGYAAQNVGPMRVDGRKCKNNGVGGRSVTVLLVYSLLYIKPNNKQQYRSRSRRSVYRVRYAIVIIYRDRVGFLLL